MATVTDGYDDLQAEVKVPPGRQRNYFQLDNADRWLVIGSMSLAYISGKTVSHPLGWIIVLLLAIALIRLSDGRLYFMAYVVLDSWWIDHVKHHKLWSKPKPTGDLIADKKAAAQTRKRVVPFKVWELPLEASPLEGETVGVQPSEKPRPIQNYGIAHHPAAHTDSFVIVSDGSPFASQSPLVHRQLLNRLAYQIKQSIHLPGYRIGFSLVFRRDPLDSYAMTANNGSWQHPGVFNPQRPGRNATALEIRNFNLGQNALEGDEQLRRLSGEIWMATVVTIQRDLVLREAEGGELRESDIANLTVTRISDALLQGYTSLGIHNPRVLDLPGLQRFLRGAWDSETIAEYYKQCYFNPDSVRDSDLHWFQGEALAYPTYSANDGTHTAVLRAVGSRRSMSDSYFRSVLRLDVPNLAVTVVSDGIKVKGEIALLDRVISLNEQTQRKRAAVTNTIAARRSLDETRERQRALEAAGVNQRYNILFGLRASSPKELQDRVRYVSDKCSLRDMPVNQIMRSSLQHPAMWSVGTGINML